MSNFPGLGSRPFPPCAWWRVVARGERGLEPRLQLSHFQNSMMYAHSEFCSVRVENNTITTRDETNTNVRVFLKYFTVRNVKNKYENKMPHCNHSHSKMMKRIIRIRANQDFSPESRRIKS